MANRRIGPFLLSLALACALTACGVTEGDATGRAADPGGGVTASTTPVGPTTSGGPATTTEPFEAGTTYRSEDGWSIETGPDWVQGAAPFKGASTWYVAAARDGFRPNVGVIVQPNQGMDLERYLDISERSMGAVDGGKLLDRSVVTADDGTELATLAYRADIGPGDLRFYAVAVPQGDDMVLATFTSSEDRYDDLADEVEPLLRTLRAG